MKRKTYLIIIMIFSIALSSVSAQEIDFGIKLGYVKSSERTSLDDISYDIKSLNNYNLGMILKLQPFKKLGFQIEPTYIRKGSNHYIDNIWEDNNYKFDYLSMPLLLTYNPLLNLDFLAGLEFGYLVNMDSKFMHKDNLKEIYDKPAEVGLQFGVSYALFNKVYVSAMYFYGLTPTSKVNILDDQGTVSGDELKTYNKGFMINFGYLLF